MKRIEIRSCNPGASRLGLDLRGGKRPAARPIIRGYAAVYDSLSSPIGGRFVERIAPGAFAAVLKRYPDVRALVDHDPSKILGRTKAGTLRLTSDAHGLAVEIHPPETTVAETIIEALRRGDVDQMSFGFAAIKDEWAEVKYDGATWPCRTLLDLDLFDVSIVTFPAYESTSVGLGDDAALARSERTVAAARAWLMRAQLLTASA